MGDPLDLTLARISTKLRGRTLGAPLSLAAVEAFETEHGVRLPEEYRRFLLQSGNGGAGPPLYGLMRLGEVPRDFDRNGQDQLARLLRPFPLSRYWAWEADEPLNDEHQALRASVGDGTLVLGHDGCGMYWHFVITGPERGQVWQITDVGAQPCAPRRDFLSWYEYWLDGHDDWWSAIDTTT
jgi:hypothetical protein